MYTGKIGSNLKDFRIKRLAYTFTHKMHASQTHAETNIDEHTHRDRDRDRDRIRDKDGHRHTGTGVDTDAHARTHTL